MNSATVDSRSLKWVMLGAVAGVGNFFTVPDELAKIGGVSFFFWHAIALIFLCAPLICAELMWGKWLRRSLHESFEVVHRRAKDLAAVILLSIGFAFPPYIYSFSLFVVKSVVFFMASLGLASKYLQTEDFIYLPYFGSLVLAGLALLSLRLSRKKFAYLIRGLLIFSVLALLGVAFSIIEQWGLQSHLQLLRKGFRDLQPGDIRRVVGFSFFSVTLCCSVFFTLIQWLPKKRVEEGGLIWISFFLIAGDFLASLLCFLIVAPFVRPGLAVGPEEMYLNLIPHSLVYLDGGYSTIFLICVSLLALGFCTIAVIFCVVAEQLETSLQHSRKKTLVRLSWWSGVALFLPIVPKLRVEMSHWALQLLMPLAGLIFAVVVLWKMPPKSQGLMIGQGFYLDGMLRFWRFSMFYLVLPYLILTLIWNF